MEERKYIVFLGKDEIGTYTAQEIHEQFGILKKNVCKYAYAGTRYRGQYRFVAVQEPKKLPVEVREDWPEEWDVAAGVIREVIGVEKLIREKWDNTVRPFRKSSDSIWRV